MAALGARVPTYLRKAAIFASGYVAFSLIVFVHGYLRGRAVDSGSTLSYSMGGLERHLFHGTPTVWLQHWTPGSYEIFPLLAFIVWSSLFYLPLLLCAVVLAVKGPRAFFGLVALHAVLVFSSDVVYGFFPTRPPWVDLPVARIIADLSYNAVALDNNILASSPSLHVGVPAAYALWFWGAGGRNFRRLGAALGVWTLLMTWAVVYTGEHYVLDTVAGVAWVTGVYVLLSRLGVFGPRETKPRLRVLRAPRFIPALRPLRARQYEAGEQRAA